MLKPDYLKDETHWGAMWDSFIPTISSSGREQVIHRKVHIGRFTDS
jgi:hypothetical protein